jgi:hypothetical protein
MQQCWKTGKNQLKSMPINKIMRKMEKTSDNTVENSLPELRRRLARDSPKTTKLAGIRQTMPEISKPMTTDSIDDYNIAIQHQLSCGPNKPGSLAATFITKHHRPGQPNNKTDHHLPSITICGHEAHFPDCRRTK